MATRDAKVWYKSFGAHIALHVSQHVPWGPDLEVEESAFALLAFSLALVLFFAFLLLPL